MSCHFVFRGAWLINFNRWFLFAFTHPYSGLCFSFFTFHFYAFFSLFLLLFSVMDKLNRNDEGIWTLNAQQCTKSVPTHLAEMQIWTCLGSGLVGLRKATWLTAVSPDYLVFSRLRADSPGLLAEHGFSYMSGHTCVVLRKLRLTLTKIWVLLATTKSHCDTEGRKALNNYERGCVL